MKLLHLALPVLLVACRSARTEVDEVLPETVELAGEGFVAEESTESAEFTATHWWTSFEDPVLDSLVEAVLAGNLDLMEAAANVREADARARSAHGARLPSIDADFLASRNRTFIGGLGRFYSTTLGPQVSVAWQADLFGRLRSTERARIAEVFATEADQLALAHSLVEQAARSRVEISLFDRRLLLANDVVASRTGTLEIVERRYGRGVRSTSAVDVHLARENLAAARTALPAFQRNREQAGFALDVLLGNQPGRGFDMEVLAAPLPLTEPPPAGVPVALLDRRPDLVAARLRLEGAAAEVDASLAALYPDLTFGGTAGWSAEELDDLFSAESLVASLFASLTMPVFNGGQLRADVEAAEARLEALAFSYSARILQSVREVNDALIAERRLREELETRITQRDEALAAEDLARDRYARGLENLLTVLDTERRRANADDQVLLLQAAVWNARIDLHLALGGDWFNQTDEGAK